jgi:hypothetical protein
LSLRELATLLRKWMAFSRSGLPASFVRHNFLRGADLGLSLLGVGLALALGDHGALLVALSALLVFTYSQMALHRSFSGAPVPLRFFWVPLVVPFVSGFLLATTRIMRTIEWRGQSYQLNGAARLASEAALSAATAMRSSVAPAAPSRSSLLPH